MKSIKEALKNYVVELVKKNTSDDKPYFFIKWSGLPELAKQYGLDILDIIDELANEGRLKKALIKKKLAIYLPNRTISQKAKILKNDFERYLKNFE
jgi:hypothetical protein